ncbi:histidine phosphatase family protein [Kitasatospora sp. NPDC089913]|uniref:histidine phosphatase family protein n=1 Tax=Kitasatospora sp. NPDC089913 TaxID=3364080 RepID=UPI0038215633
MTGHRRFVLVRHAQASVNVLRDDDLMPGFDPDADLTALGRRQAAALGAHLRRGSARWAAPRLSDWRLISSPQRRAARTAQVLSGALGLPSEHDTRLAEVGAPERFPRPLRVHEWDAVLEQRLLRPDERIAGVESWTAQRARVREFLAACGGPPERRGGLVLVSHAETIQALLFELLGLGDELLRTVRFRISNTGVFIVDRTEEECSSLVVANSKAHLARTA